MYAAAGDQPPKLCHETMGKQTAERVKLYERVPLPGEPIPINVEPKEVEDACPGDVELRDVVRGLRNGRAGGTRGIWAETIKGWLRGMEREEWEEEGKAGAGDAWRMFLKLIERLWETGCIPQQMLWMVIVLLPKGGGDYRRIGLLDSIWKVVEAVMDNRLKVLDYHDCLHGFLAGRGTGTATTEVKLAQQLAYIEQVPLYGVFIDLRKAYDAMDRGRCLKILTAHGMGPKMLKVIGFVWDHAVLVCCTGGCYWEPFQA